MPKRKPKKTLVNKTVKPRKKCGKCKPDDVIKRIQKSNPLAFEKALDHFPSYTGKPSPLLGLLKKATTSMPDDTIFHEDYYGSHDGEVKSKLKPRPSIWQRIKDWIKWIKESPEARLPCS